MGVKRVARCRLKRRWLLCLPLLLASCAPPQAEQPASPKPSPNVAPVSCPVLTGTEPNLIQLTDIEVTNRGTYDQVVFTFDSAGTAGGPQSWEVKEATGPFKAEPSDIPMAVAGSTFFEVAFRGASGVDLSGPTFVQTYTGPTEFTPDYPAVAEAELLEDYERDLRWIVGLNQNRCPTAEVMEGSALVIDFPH